MSDIQIKQKQDDGLYHKLYVKTTAVQSLLSDTTSNLFGEANKSAEDGLQAIVNDITSNRIVVIKCVDRNNNPLPGVIADGIVGSPSTNSKGLVGGRLGFYNSVTLTSNYIDIQSETVDMTDYIGKIKPRIVQMNTLEEGHIIRFTSSTTIKFSSAVKSVDVCCVGGGGGGSGNPSYQSSSGQSIVEYGPGGGGGGIVNSLGITPQKNVTLNLIIGSGGSSGLPLPYNTSGSGTDGGTSSFLGVSANGGGGGITRVYKFGSTYNVEILKGSEGSNGSGFGGADDGPTSNTTLSEFNDGSTFYSGGGAQGASYRQTPGGSPYGASGSYVDYDVRNQEITAKVNAGSAGFGGGGGGGTFIELDSASGNANPSFGGSGLIAIRFHF